MTLYVKSGGVFQATGGATPDENGWIRPPDWLPLPEVLSTDQKFVGLMAVWDVPLQCVAFLFRGAYTVDWGDGTTTNHADNTTAEHEYTYATIPANTLSSRGYKQVIITVTPQGAGNLTQVELRSRHSALAPALAPTVGWLELVIAMPNATGFALLNGGSNFSHPRFCEKVTFKAAWSAAINFQNMFVNSTRFASLVFDGFTPNIGAANAGFQVLRQPIAPPLNYPAITNLNNTFGASRIQEANITVGAVDCSNLFSNADTLIKVSGSFLAATGATNIFNNCRSLSVFDAIPPGISFSVINCPLTRTELVKIFNNLLDRTELSEATITVTNCPGTASLTGDDIAIATDKNWVVVT